MEGSILVVVLISVLLIAGFVWVTYNKLITLRMKVKEALADIDVQLKKRYDLLPDLIETARKATAVDEKILTEVTELRSQAMEGSARGENLTKRAKVESELTGMMRDIKVQVEAYPDIKSHAELTNLMDKVTDIEEKISYSRRFYNASVLAYNTGLKTFPAVLVANSIGFKEEPFFASSDEEKKDVKVDFKESQNNK